MNYAGQQPYAMTNTSLIGHSFGVPKSGRRITGDRTAITLACFHPTTVTVRVAEGPRFIAPGLDNQTARCTYMMKRSTHEETFPESAKIRASRAHMPWRGLHGSVSKAAELFSMCAHVAPHTRTHY